MFKQAGHFVIDACTIDEDDLLLVALDAGAADVGADDGMYEVTTTTTKFAGVREAFDNNGIKCEQAELAMLPASYIKLQGSEAKKCLKLMESLEDHDDVQGVYTNADIDPEEFTEAATG